MQVSRVLITVVHLQTRRRESLGHLRQLSLLHNCVRSQILALLSARRTAEIALPRMPLIRRSILLGERVVDCFTHEEAEDEKDDQEAREASDERDNAADVDVFYFVAGMLGIAHRRDRMNRAFGGPHEMMSVVSVNGHVQAPEALPYVGHSR